MARLTCLATITAGVARHPAVAAWRDVDGSAAIPGCVHVMLERASTSIYRLVGVGGGRSDVIAKRCEPAIGSIERTVYEDVIRHLPVTAPRYYGCKLDNGSCWLFLEDVGDARYSASNDEHRALAGRWLGHMHTEASRCPAAARVARRLPDGGPGRYREHLRAACDAIAKNLSNPALPGDDVATLMTVVAGHRALESRWEGWVANACAGIPPTLVHGDFRPKNVYLRDEGGLSHLFPIDWEMAGWGIPAADLTRVDVRAYWSVVRERWAVDLETIERVAVFGQIFRLLAAISWETTNLEFEVYERLVRPMLSIRVLSAQLVEAIREAQARSPSRAFLSGPPSPPPDGNDAERLPERAPLGIAEIRDALRDAWNGMEGAGQLIGHQSIKRRVHRVHVMASGSVRSFVLKRFEPRAAELNRLVVQRWLPALGLGDCTPRVLGIAGDRRGRGVWHLYEDLGDWTLHGNEPDPRRVEVAVELIARLHTGAARHPLLSECRHHGGDLGIHYFTSNVEDAIRGLEALRPPRVEPTAEHRAVRDRLLARLYALLEDRPRRASALEQQGGPETLLHGDLWTSNVLVPPADSPHAWLIDWDHAGVGPIGYDLSTLLYRFRTEDRPWVLDCYARAVARAGWRLPAVPVLNLLFDTAECARYAHRATWPAVALLLQERAEWAFGELEQVLGWFERLEPVLPA